MPTVRGCNLPDELLYDVENNIWYRENADGTVTLGMTAVAAAMAGQLVAFTGDLMTAAEAHRIGLINHVVPAGTEREAAIALAQKVALKSAYTVKLGKEAFYRQIEMSLADAYRYAAEVMTENMMARDAEEGIGAFIEKRAPTWRDE